jgi:hypothetical protein
MVPPGFCWKRREMICLRSGSAGSPRGINAKRDVQRAKAGQRRNCENEDNETAEDGKPPTDLSGEEKQSDERNDDHANYAIPMAHVGAGHEVHSMN